MLKLKRDIFIDTDYHNLTVIGEFSGRDSVAAILKAYEEGEDYILPIATFAGTEYGNFDSITDNYIKLKKRVNKLYGDTKVLYPLIEYNDEELWHLLNGRFASVLQSKFNFYNPCIGCHLYFHLTKLKFAEKLSRKVISGERESHDGRIKVNQLHEVLEIYKDILKVFDYELLMPIQEVSKGKEISRLIGWNWDEGKDHPKCVLSGNYRDINGKALYNSMDLELFLENYIKPVGIIAGNYVLGKISLHTLTESIKEIL